MGFGFGKSIVTDGLVFYVDAANSKSYVSGSNSVDNLRDTLTNTGTLINGVSFDSANGGSFDFDGQDLLFYFG